MSIPLEDELNQQVFATLINANGASGIVTAEQILALECGTSKVQRLQNRFVDLLSYCGNFGEVTAVTRNAQAASKIRGNYQVNLVSKQIIHGSLGHSHILIEQDLLNSVYLVHEDLKFSLQFFDLYGNAVHKVYFEETLAPASVFSDFLSDDQDCLVRNIKQPDFENPNRVDTFFYGKSIQNPEILFHFLQTARRENIHIYINIENFCVQQTFFGMLSDFNEYDNSFSNDETGFQLKIQPNSIVKVGIIERSHSTGTIELVAAANQNLILAAGAAADEEIWRSLRIYSNTQDFNLKIK